MTKVCSRSMVLLFGVAAATFCGCGGTPPGAKQQAENQAAIERVAVVKPEVKTLTLSTTQPGRIEALEETPLFAKIAGYVDNMLVDIGDVVQKDQVLVKLSIPELVDELEQKEAHVAQAVAEAKQVESAIEASIASAQTAESRISEAKAGIDRAQAEERRWQSEHARIQELAAKGSVTKKLEEETQSQLQAAEAAAREAVAKVESTRAAYQEAQANVGKARADQGAADARLRVAEADLARAKTLLAYAEIKAPFDGMVTRRAVDTGHYVHPAAGGEPEPLLVIARTDVARIFIDVPELEAPYLDAGDPAVVKIQALASKPLDATVTRSSWSLLEANHALRAAVDVPNPQGLLRPGMYAAVTIRLEEHPGVICLPIAAIVREGNETFCLSMEAGKVVKRPVQLGLRSGAEVEIVSGIEPGAAVIAKPGGLKPGQPVEVAADAK